MNGGSISDTINGLLAQGENILLGVILVMVVASIAMAWRRSQSWIPAIGVGIVGAGALWLAANVTDFRDKVETEVQNAPQHADELGDVDGNSTTGTP